MNWHNWMKPTCLPAIILFFCAFCAGSVELRAQTVQVEGYVFETNNRGFLSQVNVLISQIPGGGKVTESTSDAEGKVSFELAPGSYQATLSKDLFIDSTYRFEVADSAVYLKMALQRKPGYLFEATLADKIEDDTKYVDAISGATVEIYNRTRDESELVLRQHPHAFFSFYFEQGNHYTMLIRKPGYLTKRIEAFINVEGCILCLHGINEFRPGVAENLTAGNTMGTLVANIELEKAKVDKRLSLTNIYYDLNKWDIKPQAAEKLDQFVQFLTDNPELSVELGSHTDSRGDSLYNDNLSQKRAESAVAYIVRAGIDSARITAKGYGESQLTNKCSDGVTCPEAMHAANRRTELRITGVPDDSLEYLRWVSLEDMIRQEKAAEQPSPPEPETVGKSTPESPGTSGLKTRSAPKVDEAPPVPTLPDSKTFFGIELLCTDYVMQMSAFSTFEHKDRLYMLPDGPGQYCYILYFNGSKEELEDWYKREWSDQTGQTRLVYIENGQKTYLP